jgi:hypothetical protein
MGLAAAAYAGFAIADLPGIPKMRFESFAPA